MRIRTSAAALSDFELVAMSELNPAEMAPAKVFGKDDEVQKLDGHELYRLPDVFVKADGHRATASIKVMAKPAKPIEELTKIRLTGTVIITPYVASGRVALSIVAEGVEPVE